MPPPVEGGGCSCEFCNLLRRAGETVHRLRVHEHRVEVFSKLHQAYVLALEHTLLVSREGAPGGEPAGLGCHPESATGSACATSRISSKGRRGSKRD